MTTEAIYQKYITAMQQVTGGGTWVDWSAVRLALRLALQDAHDAGLQTCAGMADDLAAIAANQDKALQNALDQIDALRHERNAQPDQHTHEHLQSQITRLNEWIAEHEPGLYISPGDTADATLAALAYRDQRVAALQQEIARLSDHITALYAQPDQRAHEQMQEQITRLNEWLTGHAPASMRDGIYTADAILAIIDSLQGVVAEYQQQLAQMDADNSDLLNKLKQAQQEIDRLTRENTTAVDTFNSLQPAIHTNGDAPARPAPTDWHVFLDDEADDWRISLDAGRRRFGDIPKIARLHIIQALLRGTQIDTGNTAAMPTMADYDAVRPDWAPGSTGLTRTFGCGWRDILDLTEVAE